MTYELRYETPQIDDYIRIRLAAGMSRKSLEAATIGLANTICGVVVYCDETPVGIGRVIGDGGCFFEIVDIGIEPEHQKKGLGDMNDHGKPNVIRPRKRAGHRIRELDG